MKDYRVQIYKTKYLYIKLKCICLQTLYRVFSDSKKKFVIRKYKFLSGTKCRFYTCSN